MKAKLVKITKPLLMACIAFDVWFTFDIASAIFFGEYEHPKNPNE